MRYCELTLRQPGWMRHPVQEFVREGDAVQYGEAYERYCERVPRFVDLRSPSPPADDAGY